MNEYAVFALASEFYLESSEYSVNEDDGNVTFTVIRSGDTSGEETIGEFKLSSAKT